MRWHKDTLVKDTSDTYVEKYLKTHIFLKIQKKIYKKFSFYFVRINGLNTICFGILGICTINS